MCHLEQNCFKFQLITPFVTCFLQIETFMMLNLFVAGVKVYRVLTFGDTAPCLMAACVNGFAEILISCT